MLRMMSSIAASKPCSKLISVCWWTVGSAFKYGHHDEFVRNIVDNPKFSAWLNKVKQDLLWRSQGWAPAELFRIGVFCKQGNKHSVGCSLILQSILERHGYLVKPVIHCSKAFWPARKICNSSCETCQNGDGASLMKWLALWDANKAWNLL